MRKSNRDESMTDTFRNMMGRADMRKDTATALSAQSVKLFNAKTVRWRYGGPQSSQKDVGPRAKGPVSFKATPRTKAWLWMLLTRARNNHLENALSLELLHL